MIKRGKQSVNKIANEYFRELEKDGFDSSRENLPRSNAKKKVIISIHVSLN